jgi:hypothetical protein
VAEFLVELYISRVDGSRVDLAADALTRAGTSLRCVRTIFVPEDETGFLLFEAGSVDDVLDAARNAGITPARVSEAVTSPIVTDA